MRDIESVTGRAGDVGAAAWNASLDAIAEGRTRVDAVLDAIGLS